MIFNKSIPASTDAEPKKVSISDLITQCNEAASKMSVNNPHRLLVLGCAYAMRQMVDRQAQMEEDIKKLKQVH